MKAIIQEQFGSADVLTYTETEMPMLSAGECLIRVAYSSVNYADIKSRIGSKGAGNFPLMLGLDTAGTIVDASPGSDLKVGDRVIAFPKFGSYADYVVANQVLVYKIPDTLSFKQAAAMPTVSILSYLLLHEIGNVQSTDTVVIHSAAGGVGSMLVQLAKRANVQTIIGTVGNLDKADYVKQLGAHEVYTYDTFAEETLQRTDAKGATVIFDSVAGDVTRKSLDALALYGTLVQFGNSSGKAGQLSTNDVHSSCRNIKGFSLGTTRKHAPERLLPVAEKVISLFASGDISLPIAEVFDLQNAADAHRFIEARNYEGKVLLKVAGE